MFDPMSYESALARVSELHALVAPQQVAAALPAVVGAATGAAFAQQLQLALQQQAGGEDADATGLGQLPQGALLSGGSPYGASPYGVSPYGASPYGASSYGASPYGVSPYGAGTPYAVTPYGQPYAMLLPGAAVPGIGGMGGVAPGTFPMVTGDTDGLDRDLLARLNQVGVQLGKQVHVESGFRSREEQAHLYQMYLNGTGNLAAPPGYSNHESGKAADVYVDGIALASHARAKDIAQSLGLGWPVGGEAWHTEIVR